MLSPFLANGLDFFQEQHPGAVLAAALVRFFVVGAPVTAVARVSVAPELEEHDTRGGRGHGVVEGGDPGRTDAVERQVESDQAP